MKTEHHNAGLNGCAATNFFKKISIIASAAVAMCQ
jgi:hypothetical protein